MKIYTSVDLRYNEIQNARIQTIQPDNPKKGTIYYDEINNRIKYFTGTAWIPIGGEGGGGGGELNLLEHIKVNGTTLSNNGNLKTAHLGLSSSGNGELVVKDNTTNRIISTINIGSGEILPGTLVAVGILDAGSAKYTLEHELNTDYLVVQVIDSLGNTVECNVRRYTESGVHLIDVEFTTETTQSYKVVAVGHPKYSLMKEKQQ